MKKTDLKKAEQNFLKLREAGRNEINPIKLAHATYGLLKLELNKYSDMTFNRQIITGFADAMLKEEFNYLLFDLLDKNGNVIWHIKEKIELSEYYYKLCFYLYNKDEILFSDDDIINAKIYFPPAT